MKLSYSNKVLNLARKAGVIRSRDLASIGIPRQYLKILVQQGMIQRVGYGLYAAIGAEVTAEHTLVEASKKVPKGVLCLLSALRMHGLTTQAPFEVWMAIDRKAWRPKVEYPPLRIVRFSGKALASRIQRRQIEGVLVQVYDPAKTVADCFKYRNKIGLDVAIEALRDCWEKRLATMDDLWDAAAICRVSKIIRPYLESLTWS
ncbi:MAG: transcriptional regulator [Planctomycetaceae bacterium]|nr:MAG: transcriptional regulator [Planctomycetaceae bacterium]